MSETNVFAAESCIDCRACVNYVKNSCWSAIKCIGGDWYHHSGPIQLWDKKTEITNESQN